MRCVVWCVLGGAVVGCDGVLWCCGVVCGVWCVVCGVVWCGVVWCCLLQWWDNVVFGCSRPIDWQMHNFWLFSEAPGP